MIWKELDLPQGLNTTDRDDGVFVPCHLCHTTIDIQFGKIGECVTCFEEHYLCSKCKNDMSEMYGTNQSGLVNTCSKCVVKNDKMSSSMPSSQQTFTLPDLEKAVTEGIITATQFLQLKNLKNVTGDT